MRRVIFSSSREVYGEPASLPVPETSPLSPKNAYGVSKVAGEMCCDLFDDARLEVIIFRFANVFGPRDRDRVIPLFAEPALAGEPLTAFGNGKIVDFLRIFNLVDVLCRAAQGPCPDSPVDLGSGKGTNLVDLARRILALAGRTSAISVTEERQPEVSRALWRMWARPSSSINCVVPRTRLSHPRPRGKKGPSHTRFDMLRCEHQMRTEMAMQERPHI